MNTLRIAIPGLVAALALAGCGDTLPQKTETVDADLCAELGRTCNDPTGDIRCDPADGVCKCGGHGGLVCPELTVCQLDRTLSPAAPSCVSPLCDGVTCPSFEACDAADGLCKCAGEVCGAGQTCLADGCSGVDPCFGVVCPGNETCDPADRTCKCGGNTCSVGESCRMGDAGVASCVGRACVGKNCAPGTVCGPADGLCHCGSLEGDVCTIGQVCVTEGTESSCSGHDACADVTCPADAVCSPTDGKCHCGGFGATAPVCAPDQICDLAQNPPRCTHGDACEDVTCAVGTNLSCDAETGECRCGGTGGVACAAEEGCVDAAGLPTCVTRCDPTADDVLVQVCGHTPGAPKGCYLSPADGVAYCTAAGAQAEGADCDDPTDCAAEHHCVQTEGGGVCRRYCDTRIPGDCLQTDRSCVPIAGRPESLSYLGVCMVVTP